MTPSNEQMQNTTASVMAAYEELGMMAREHMDATMKSVAAVTKGFDELTRSASGIMQESVARAASAGKTMMGIRNMREMTDLHQEMVKDMIDSWVASTSRMSEISARLTQDVVAPLTEQTNKVIHKIVQKVKTAA